MKRPPPNWEDLKPRLLTGAALIVIGTVEIWLGGLWFASMVALITGVMIWELARMIDPAHAAHSVRIGLAAGAVTLAARYLPVQQALPLLAMPAIIGAFMRRTYKAIFMLYAAGILLAGYGLIVFRDTYDIVWFCWLIIVVVVTDIGGYFGGRMIGGAKFWPSISPKKTWAGILTGWGASALVGAAFLAITDAGRDIIWISVVLSFASQMGDIAESAVKRRMGVKDSSSLLPGHGGFLDRFDGILGASLFMLLTALIVDVPELRF